MYAAGIPVGLLVDSRGPRPGALLGAVSLGVGYFCIYKCTEFQKPQILASNPLSSLRGWS